MIVGVFGLMRSCEIKALKMDDVVEKNDKTNNPIEYHITITQSKTDKKEKVSNL